MKTIWVPVVVASLLFSPSPCEGARCSCIERLSPEQAGLLSDAIFLGTVERVVERSGHSESDRYDPSAGVSYLEVHFQVEAAWKGVSAPSAVVSTGVGAGDCGFPFEPGQRYLVYARAVDELLTTSSCSRTALVERAEGDLAVLGPPGGARKH